MPTIIVGSNSTNTGVYHDTNLRGGVNQNLAYGAERSLWVRGGTFNGDDYRHGLFAFNLNGLLPAGSTINSVELHMWSKGTSGVEQSFRFYKLLQTGWSEGEENGSAGWPNWSEYADGGEWGAGGASQSSVDIEGDINTPSTAAVTGLMPASTAEHTEFIFSGEHFPELLNHVRDHSDEGVHFLTSAATNTTSRFVSRDDTDGFMPELHITYSLSADGGGTPNWSFSPAIARRRQMLRGLI